MLLGSKFKGLGLKEKSIIVSTVVFFMLGLVGAVIIFLLLNKTYVEISDEYTKAYVLKHHEKLLSAIEFDIRLTSEFLKQNDVKEFFIDEYNIDKKQKAFNLAKSYINSANADGWFFAVRQSGNFYYNDANDTFKNNELRSNLSSQNPKNDWFYYTLTAISQYNFNIDHDYSIDQTKVWLNMPVVHEDKVVGVAGSGTDYFGFINDYLLADNININAYLLDTQGSIVASKDKSKINFNLNYIKENQKRKIFDFISDSSFEQMFFIKVYQLMNNQYLNNTSFVINIDNKKQVVALSYIPHTNWIMLAMLDTSSMFNANEIILMLSIFIILSFFIIYLVFDLIRLHFIRPMQLISTYMAQVSSGNMTVRMQNFIDNKDEIGQFARNFNMMLKNLSQNQEIIEQRYKWVTENSHDIIWVMELDGIIRYITPSVTIKLGYSVDEVVGNVFEKFIDKSFLRDVKYLIDESLKEYLAGKIPEVKNVSLKLISKNGTNIWFELEGRLVLDEKNNPYRFIGSAKDISLRKKDEAQIVQLAYYDILTNISNRRLLFDRLNSNLKNRGKDNYYSALVFMDIDNFRDINDNFGHSTGDELLVNIAKRLQSSITLADTLSRFGGDEFIILIDKISDDYNATYEYCNNIGLKICELIAKKYILSKSIVTITTSIGIKIFDGKYSDKDTILHAADNAMYQAKQSGKNKAIVV